MNAGEEHLFNIGLVLGPLVLGFSTGAEGRGKLDTAFVQRQCMTEDLDGIVRVGEW